MRLRAKVLGIASATVACGGQGGAARDAGAIDVSAHVDATPHADATAIEAAVDVDAACGDVETDPHNCGACGRDCDGGACRVGSCAPLPAGELASGQHTPFGIAIDDASVYWMNRGTYSPSTQSYGGAQLMKCAKAGCGNAPTVLASGSWTGMTKLVVSAGMVYWAADDLVLACATDGCAASGPTQLLAGTLTPTDIAVNATTVFFADANPTNGSTGLLTCPLAGCGMGAIAIPTSAPPLVIALDGDAVFFATEDSTVLYTCDLVMDGCSPGPVMGGQAPTAIAVDGTNVYVAGRGQGATIAFCPETGCQGSPFVVSNSLTFCAGIASDGADVYFTDRGVTVDGGSGGAGRVAKCSITGCGGSPAPAAGYVNFPQQIAVDDKNVYWTDFGSGTDPGGSDDGRVMAVPK